jgi:hypothetical protein
MCNRYNPARADEIAYWRDMFGIDERPQGHVGDPLFPSMTRDIGPFGRGSFESYTMITLNADHHPLLRRMHRPDLSRPVEMQDKRAVAPLAPASFEAWLRGTIEDATAALALPDEASFAAGPDAIKPPDLQTPQAPLL